jgi:hypothetical protein
MNRVRGAFFIILLKEEMMENLWEVGALILGYLSIGLLVAQSMISIDRNLKARQAGMRESNLSKYRSDDYSMGPV